jgi:uroporphyrinogen decarboxylase
MHAADRLQAVFDGRLPNRVPFMPIIREHAAYLAGITPSEMAQDAARMAEAQLRAFERYEHDLVSLGVDTYNLEAEAMGARVTFFDGGGTPVLAGALLADPSTLRALRVPDPSRDGRLPLVLEAGARLKARLPDGVPLSATVVGPFTLAANLRGFEDLVMDWYDQPAFVRDLLAFATAVGRRWGEAIIRAGLSASISESWVSPPLLSPAMYREWALPAERELIAHFAACGQRHTALVCGGDTMPILNGLLETGAASLVADFTCDLATFKARAAAAGVATRGNLDPKLLQAGPPEAIQTAACRILAKGKPGGRFMLGAGVVPFATPPEHVLALKKAVESDGRY